MSIRSCACVSMVAMRLDRSPAHRILELLMRSQRQPLHFREITGALLLGHRAAYFFKMLEHLWLAFCSQIPEFDQLLFNLPIGGVGGNHRVQLVSFGGNLLTHFPAFRQISFM